jgi:hypothetical protein
MVTNRKVGGASYTLCIEYTKIHSKFIFVAWKPILMSKVKTSATDTDFLCDPF